MGITRQEFLLNAAAAGAVMAVGAAAARPAAAAARPIRPPGARPEEEFLSLCIRCGRCGDACPNQAIQAFTRGSGARFSLSPGRGEEGTPVIFPRLMACSLCSGDAGDVLRCGEACPSGALQLVRKAPETVQASVRMGTAKVDENLCFSFNHSCCGVCIRACPFKGKALRAGPHETPVIDPAYCVGCGLCERSCVRYPQAITVRAGERVIA